jgi:hypothetical protein
MRCYEHSSACQKLGERSVALFKIISRSLLDELPTVKHTNRYRNMKTTKDLTSTQTTAAVLVLCLDELHHVFDDQRLLTARRARLPAGSAPADPAA